MKKKMCEVHKIEMKKSVGWYGVKWECQKCLSESHTPNGKKKIFTDSTV